MKSVINKPARTRKSKSKKDKIFIVKEKDMRDLGEMTNEEFMKEFLSRK